MRSSHVQNHRRQRRSGAAILIVISMLTLISIVGVSFVYYSDSRQVDDRYFQESPKDLAIESLDLARVVRSDLVGAIRGDLDFSLSLQKIDQFAENVRRQKEDICAAAQRESDPKVRNKLQSLCKDLEALCRKTATLRQQLEELSR